MSYADNLGSNPLPFTDPEAVDNHIVALTGVQPYPIDRSEIIPAAETREMIWGANLGDPSASTLLIASKMRWLYGYMRDSVMQYPYLEAEDMLQTAGQAVIETATVIDPASPNSIVTFYAGVRRRVDQFLVVPEVTSEVPVGTAWDVLELSAETGEAANDIDELSLKVPTDAEYEQALATPHSARTHEQRAILWEQWLAEIAEKQARGRIAFVRGDLLAGPLPPQVEEFIERSSQGRQTGTHYNAMRAAITASGHSV